MMQNGRINEPAHRTAGMPTIISHSYSHASDDTAQRVRLSSIHTPARMPPGMPAWQTAHMRPVNSHLLSWHMGRVAARILFFYFDD